MLSGTILNLPLLRKNRLIINNKSKNDSIPKLIPKLNTNKNKENQTHISFKLKDKDKDSFKSINYEELSTNNANTMIVDVFKKKKYNNSINYKTLVNSRSKKKKINFDYQYNHEETKKYNRKIKI